METNTRKCCTGINAQMGVGQILLSNDDEAQIKL